MDCIYNVYDDIGFEWDIVKAKSNMEKHGVSFEEAASAFFDPEALYLADTNHSAAEERFYLIGLSDKTRLLIVSHCYRNAERIRIISSRKATATEAKYYENK